MYYSTIIDKNELRLKFLSKDITVVYDVYDFPIDYVSSGEMVIGKTIIILNEKLYNFVMLNNIKVICTGWAHTKVVDITDKDLFPDEEYNIISEYIYFYNIDINILNNNDNIKKYGNFTGNECVFMFPNKEILSKFKMIFS